MLWSYHERSSLWKHQRWYDKAYPNTFLRYTVYAEPFLLPYQHPHFIFNACVLISLRFIDVVIFLTPYGGPSVYSTWSHSNLSLHFYAIWSNMSPLPPYPTGRKQFCDWELWSLAAGITPETSTAIQKKKKDQTASSTVCLSGLLLHIHSLVNRWHHAAALCELSVLRISNDQLCYTWNLSDITDRSFIIRNNMKSSQSAAALCHPSSGLCICKSSPDRHAEPQL